MLVLQLEYRREMFQFACVQYAHQRYPDEQMPGFEKSTLGLHGEVVGIMQLEVYRADLDPEGDSWKKEPDVFNELLKRRDQGIDEEIKISS